MKSQRIFILIGVLAATSLAGLPGTALASSLLSGYGGPGQGSQAILGSAMLNGPKGGGGSGGGGSVALSSGSASPSGATTSSSPETSGAASPSATSRSGGSAGARARARHAGGNPKRTAAEASGQSFYPAAERVPFDVATGTLGLSGADLIYIALAAAVLASLGLLTRRLGAAGQREGAGS